MGKKVVAIPETASVTTNNSKTRNFEELIAVTFEQATPIQLSKCALQNDGQ